MQRALMMQKTRKTHTRTSDVWNDYEELFNIVNGKRTRYGVKCHYCKKILSALSTSGTGHLLRHRILDACMIYSFYSIDTCMIYSFWMHV
jgi:hypothetical protein